MKKITVTFFALVISLCVDAQSPQKMSYQAVIRNSSNVLVTTSVGMRISILQGSATGSEVYKEIFNPNPLPNLNGLVSVEIGGGIPVPPFNSTSFPSINWASGPYFLKTETDPLGGTTYTITSTTQLLSVPYALYAETAGNGGGGLDSVIHDATITGIGTVAAPLGIAPQSATNGQTLKWNGSTWLPSSDDDSQTLNLNGNNLSISGGNQVVLPSGGLGTVTSVVAGSGLNGGNITSAGTISMPNIGTAGTYGSSTQIPTITTDTQGRVSNVSLNNVIGDDWGSQDVVSNSPLSGNGTAGTPLSISAGTPGQFLKTSTGGNVIWSSSGAYSQVGSYTVANAPTSWTIYDLNSTPYTDSCSNCTFFIQIYSPIARTVYLRQPTIPNASEPTVDIAAGRTALVAVRGLNGQIEYYSNVSGSLTLCRMGLIK